MAKKYDDIEDVICAIADEFGEHLYDEIHQENSIKKLSYYAEKLGIPADELQDLIDQANS
jgi:hypothetical protein